MCIKMTDHDKKRSEYEDEITKENTFARGKKGLDSRITMSYYRNVK